MRKYKSLKGLRKAIASQRVKGVLTIDNDCSSFHAINPKKPDDDAVEIFDGGTPMDLLIECLEILGIPWENA